MYLVQHYDTYIIIEFRLYVIQKTVVTIIFIRNRLKETNDLIGFY